MADQLGEAVLKLSADSTALDAGLQRAQQQAQQTGTAIEQAFSKTGQPLQTAANGLQYYIDAQGRARDASGRLVSALQLQEAGLRNVGTAAAASSNSVNQLGEFIGKLAAQLALLETGRRALQFIGQQITELDSAGAAVRTLGVNSEELTQRLQALSVELSGSVSTIQLTKAAYDVASSGFATAADATQVLRAAALGAKGGFAEVDDVVRAVTGVLNAYGMTANEATKIVDTFLQTQNDGVITVRQYAAEIGNVASIAAASGVSLQELNAAIATATLRGVPVSQTFTGIRQALSSIIKPSQQATELAKSLGIDYSVAALQQRGFAGVLADVQRATGGATDKLAILLGSVEAQAAVQPLLNDKLVKYNELLGKQAKASGAAATAAQINSETISGGLKQIGNGFSNLAITLDKALNPIFKGFIDGLNTILVKLQQVSALSPQKVQQRETQAKDLVQAAIGPFGGSGFFGSVSVKFDGKTFTGSAAGVREDITSYLFQKELAAINKAAPSPAKLPTPPTPPPPPTETPEAQKALRAQQERFRTNRLDALLAADKLRVTQQLTALEAQAALRQTRVSETAKLRLQQQLAITEKIRQEDAARAALQTELAKPQQQRDRTVLDGLEDRVQRASNDVRQAYADAGLSLVQNARSAADALRSAEASLDSTLRGGFEFLIPRLQQEQINKARAAIQPLVGNVIREGIDISTPGQLFRVAAFAEAFTSAQSTLDQALKENTAAQLALKDKKWTVNVTVPGGTASGDVVGAINGGLR